MFIILHYVLRFAKNSGIFLSKNVCYYRLTTVRPNSMLNVDYQCNLYNASKKICYSPAYKPLREKRIASHTKILQPRNIRVFCEKYVYKKKEKKQGKKIFFKGASCALSFSFSLQAVRAYIAMPALNFRPARRKLFYPLRDCNLRQSMLCNPCDLWCEILTEKRIVARTVGMANVRDKELDDIAYDKNRIRRSERASRCRDNRADVSARAPLKRRRAIMLVSHIIYFTKRWNQ
ncbi:hypothetical protein PUN28_017077 [Cardiocondyla obscurior]|uniref:Uncharacterized protein n=1 Tax=Cardiocondyla obscurior TaxID=286306 RepID=A0AAW2ENY0_9HYME